jgi:hypothetical protein
MAGAKKKKIERTSPKNKKAKPGPSKKINSQNKPVKKTTNTAIKETPKLQQNKQSKPIDVKPSPPKEEIKPDKKASLKVFILILLIIFGGAASFMFRNLYVYILSGLVVIGMIAYLVISKPKQKLLKKKEDSKITKKPQIIKTKYMTDFDRFYNLIVERKKISISKIAKNLKMPKKQAEEWSRILEERGLIKIYYPLIGDPELRCQE